MTLWGGRFEGSPDQAMWDFTVSTADRRLLGVDVQGSLAHVAALAAAGIISTEEAESLTDGLRQIADEASAGTFSWSPSDEDVHTAVERRLGELIGDVAGKLHTGRSRNDQIALDLRLWCRASAESHVDEIRWLVEALVNAAEANAQVVVAGYTHLQQAQAVPLGHHLLAHAWALLRDRSRLKSFLERVDESPLGAGAGGGSRLSLRPDVAAEELGFSSVFANSMDAVASRDLVSEYVYCATQALVTLSRLAEELVLWASTEFGWADFSDEFTTGSSALPQKKNPDAAELARGKAASAIGALTGLLSLQKGLPLTYNRDLQEDKERLFAVGDDLDGAVRSLGGMLSGAQFRPPPPMSWVTALDLAEVLVERGVPFRDAHKAVGRVVAGLVADGLSLLDVTPERLRAAHDAFENGDVTLVDPAVSIESRRSPGGGSFESVAKQIDRIRSIL